MFHCLPPSDLRPHLQRLQLNLPAPSLRLRSSVLLPQRNPIPVMVSPCYSLQPQPIPSPSLSRSPPLTSNHVPANPPRLTHAPKFALPCFLCRRDMVGRRPRDFLPGPTPHQPSSALLPEFRSTCRPLPPVETQTHPTPYHPSPSSPPPICAIHLPVPRLSLTITTKAPPAGPPPLFCKVSLLSTRVAGRGGADVAG